MRVVFVLLFGLCCSVLLGQEPKEDPIKEFLEKVQENYYFPQDFGLKDLKATLIFEVKFGGMSHESKATLYWKPPDKLKLEFEEEVPMDPRSMQEPCKKLVEEIVISEKPLERYHKEKDTWEYELKKENDQWILTKIPTEKAENPEDVNEIKQFYGKDYFLIKSIKTSGMATTVTQSDIKYIIKEKKRLVSEYKTFAEVAGEKTYESSLKLSYKQVDKIWLLEKLTIETEADMMGQTISHTTTLTIKDPEVNKGIDDKIFEEEPEEEPEKEPKEESK